MRRRGRSAAVVRADPPVGSLFRLRGGEFSGSVLVRLLGFRENTGQCRYLLLPAHDPADFFFEFPSFSYLSGHCDAISWSDLSRSMARVLSDVLSDPPTDHLVVRSVQSAGFCTHVAGGSFGAIPLVVRVVPARPLVTILSDNPSSPRMCLDDRHCAYRALCKWGIPAEGGSSCVIYGSCYESLRTYWRRMVDLDGAELREHVLTQPCPSVLQSRVRRGVGGLLPTIPTSLHYHPILLPQLQYPSFSALLELFGLPLTDPLSVHLLSRARENAWSCRRALGTLCQGVCGKTISALVDTMKANSPLSGISHWLVATSFSGGDTFCSHLRTLGISFTLVAASEPDPWHRAAHFANHPDLAVFPADVSDSSVVSGMPFHHLRFAGFPCVSYSRLNRTVTYARLREGLRLFDSLMVSVQAQPAPVVLLENVASLLFADLDWVLEHIESSLRGLCAGRYRVFRSVLCGSELGARMFRPRVFWLLYLT